MKQFQLEKSIQNNTSEVLPIRRIWWMARPLIISNREVKHSYADGTTIEGE